MADALDLLLDALDLRETGTPDSFVGPGDIENEYGIFGGHLLGQVIAAVGADHVIWGTDSIWWGSPQWQIEAFRRFQIPETLQDKFGYQPISRKDRAQIFGLNSARLFDINVREARKAIPADALSRMKVAYEAEGAQPSMTQYGWVAAV